MASALLYDSSAPALTDLATSNTADVTQSLNTIEMMESTVVHSDSGLAAEPSRPEVAVRAPGEVRLDSHTASHVSITVKLSRPGVAVRAPGVVQPDHPARPEATCG